VIPHLRCKLERYPAAKVRDRVEWAPYTQSDARTSTSDSDSGPIHWYNRIVIVLVSAIEYRAYLLSNPCSTLQQSMIDRLR
jgi:hypothetical protein